MRDESGGVLPGVTVTMTQTDTGFMRTVATDGTGAYSMPSLPTGPYRLEVSLQGFRTYVQTGIVLQVGATPTINVVLAVGSLEETVSVVAAAPVVDVRSAGISEVVENERILELPLQGRNPVDLIILAGSAVLTNRGGPRDSNQALGISVTGGLRFGLGYALDGAMHTDTYNNQNLPLPFPDALQEFSVATSGLSAQNGMHSAASVSAVTKSGTNTFHGNAFEFLRDRRFNATSVFAPVGPEGKRVDDGLNRNQFGGTLGGPILRDRLFFFTGYQGAIVRQKTPDNLAWVPTAAMLAGDFTTFASPTCNGGRQVGLGAPFVNNRVDPALLSPAAVAIAQRLPSTDDPCGQIRFRVPLDVNESQVVSRLDYQWSSNHTVFGRYIGNFERRLPNYSRTGNVLTVAHAYSPNRRHRVHAVALGDTLVFGANTVNAFRVTWNRAGFRTNDPPDAFFDAPSLGIRLHSYVPGVIAVNVTNGFTFGNGSAVKLRAANEAYQVANDLTTVRGRHELSVGGNVAYWTADIADYARGVGDFSFNGRATGLGLADFLTGQASLVRHSGPGIHVMSQLYLGLYAQDSWRATDRVTFNLGLRWEPFFGQNVRNGAISNFSLANFRQGVTSAGYRNAPPGLLWPGDPGFPSGKTGLNKQWRNLSPRAGVAWDVTGDGRTAVRSSYGLAYDFPTAQLLYVFASAAPFGDRVELPNVRFEDPYRDFGGGLQHPLPAVPPADAAFPLFGAYGTMDPDINSPRVQSWNVTVERQIGTAWQVSASYLGSHAGRLWGQVHMNPGVFLGLDPCTIHGVFYRTCTTNANLNQRRALYLESPERGRFFGPVSRFADVGEQAYRGLRLSMRRRAADGVSLNGNYTWSHCETDTDSTGQFTQLDAGYSDPGNPSFDRGNCGGNRTQIANLTVGYLTPQVAAPVLRALVSDWRVSGILNARSGGWLTVTTTQDTAATGISGQRVDQILDDPYADRTLASYLNRAAFAQPAPGTLGSHRNNSIEGPGFWTVNLALSRLLPVSLGQTLELRAEVFNLFNNFNWGDPNTNFNAATFGRILSQAGDPRIFQFGVKYGF
ncbi:MAG: TonB-dependent receptor [Acidobacteria bacterium]|nr:TonB-dependent receptor [Acidobacteriota bacterium]